MVKQIIRRIHTRKLWFNSLLEWVQIVAADLESQQPCSAWEPLLFPLHFPLSSGATGTFGAVLWAGGEIICLRNNLLQGVFIWKCSSLTWFTKQPYKCLCHCKGGKGWRFRCVVGKELLLFPSALDHAGLLCLLLWPQSHPPRPDSILQKNQLPFLKKIYIQTRFWLFEILNWGCLEAEKPLQKLYCNSSNVITCWM